MANQEHLDILKQGVAVWNGWRQEHPDIEPDLSESDMRVADLRGANLARANLYRVDLRNAYLYSVDFTQANLVQEVSLLRHLRN